MKRYFIKTIFPILFVSLLFSRCDVTTKKSTKNEIQFDSICVERIYYMFDSFDNPNCNIQIKFVYPSDYKQDDFKAVQQRFVENFFGEKYKDMSPLDAANEYVDDYVLSYKELEEYYETEMKHNEGRPNASWYSFYESSTNEVVYNCNDLLGNAVFIENYTGGAHGSHSIQYYLIDLKTGNIINERDIFVENYQDTLAAVLIKNIAKQNGLDDIKELEDIGFFSIEEIYPNDNFMIDDTGITYLYNEYEIAAYVVGATTVHIPFEEIMHLIRRDGAIAHIVYFD
jgi:Protein of unknown function (DUF3298).